MYVEWIAQTLSYSNILYLKITHFIDGESEIQRALWDF